MSEFRKTSSDDLYFVTLTVVDWINLFDREEYKIILVDNLNYCVEHEGLEIFAYVIMSNHFHMVRRRNNHDLKELLGRFKSYTSKVLLNAITENNQESRQDWLLSMFHKAAIKNKQYSNYHLWQYTDHPVYLYSGDVIDQKIEYIHHNPVKAGYVLEPQHYKYSSACIDSPIKLAEV